MQQREKAGKVECTRLNLNVLQAADAYRRIGKSTGTYPEAGVYTRENPILNARGRPAFRPSEGVTITTDTNPEGEFTIEGKCTILAGTFTSTYDSTARGFYDADSPAVVVRRARIVEKPRARTLTVSWPSASGGFLYVRV